MDAKEVIVDHDEFEEEEEVNLEAKLINVLKELRKERKENKLLWKELKVHLEEAKVIEESLREQLEEKEEK
jgi:hypothetical protein